MRDPDWRQQARFRERLNTFIERLPALERDVIDLYFVKGKRQEVIARLLGISQQAVSHRMYSAFRRITFMMAQPEITPEQMRADLTALLPKSAFAVDVLCDFAVTSNQTATARNLKVPQQKVCWHLNAALRNLRKLVTVDALFYVNFFERLLSHRSILREILAKQPRVTEMTDVEKKRAFRGAVRRAAEAHVAGGSARAVAAQVA